ncbi:MAG TPA: methyltransferase domain-containing protein [Gaiellaceae bacterium]|nr:methyltransferase domain-containing protein [Gaiellaceae bacterium]
MLRQAWTRNAEDWIRWAREPGHDSYWRFHRDRFLELVPAPGRLTLDIGCGEGRLSRDLAALGHNVVGIDSSAKVIAAARELSPELEFIEADAADMPIADASVDLAVAFMSLMDIDDMCGAVRETSRVLALGGRLVLAVVHPMNSAHELDREGRHPEDWLVLTESYFDRRVYRDDVERDGLRMVFESRHWTLEDYFDAVLGAGFRIEALREIGSPAHPRWSRYPLFLHLLAAKASQPG